MRFRLLTAALLLAIGVAPSCAFMAFAGEGDSCTTDTGIGVVNTTCVHSVAETTALMDGEADSGHTYSIEPFCGSNDGGECFHPRDCGGDPPGQWYLIYQDGTIPIGRVCLTNDQADDLNGFNETMILRAWRRLDWPSSELTIQPPDGETLVNFDTNFLTTNDSPTVQTVHLLGRTIDIEATPTSYTWHHGDGTDQTTESPGAAYPDLEVTHDYTRTGSYAPSVDTTFTGRFRINGHAWHNIDETLTVAGDSVTLTVIEATPELVGG